MVSVRSDLWFIHKHYMFLLAKSHGDPIHKSLQLSGHQSPHSAPRTCGIMKLLTLNSPVCSGSSFYLLILRFSPSQSSWLYRQVDRYSDSWPFPWITSLSRRRSWGPRRAVAGSSLLLVEVKCSWMRQLSKSNSRVIDWICLTRNQEVSPVLGENGASPWRKLEGRLMGESEHGLNVLLVIYQNLGSDFWTLHFTNLISAFTLEWNIFKIFFFTWCYFHVYSLPF